MRLPNKFSGYFKNILFLGKTLLSEFYIMTVLNGEPEMNLKVRRTILLIGNDTALSYLLGRYAERSGYQLIVNSENSSISEISDMSPSVIIFLSTELLEKTQALVVELAGLEMPIMVCSSVADEARSRELGADYCLLHPITYDGFQTVLAIANPSK